MISRATAFLIVLYTSCGRPVDSPRDAPSETREQGNQTRRQRCAKGDGKSCLDFGLASQIGTDEGRDLPAAVWAFEQGCQLGSGPSCRLLALILMSRRAGLPHDEPRARALVRKACALQDPVACELARDMAEVE